MSESSNSSSESSGYGRTAYSRNEPTSRSSESVGSSESQNTSYVAPPVSMEKPTEAKPNYNNIKNQLLLLEKAVTKDFSTEEKNQFLKIYRQIIVENEIEVTATPTPSFFLSKFNRSEDINSNLKSKIVIKLNECMAEEKTKKSKLKYW